MKQKLEELRQEINSMVASGEYDYDELVKKSQELDKYIVHVMKESLRAYTKPHDSNMGGIRMVIKNIKKIHHMYDSIRIVDPLSKEVYRMKECSLCNIGSFCYRTIGKQCICENCISMRSLIEDDIITKIELISEHYFYIVAIPIEFQGRKLVVEIFRDVTGNLETRNDENEYINKMLTSIEHMNNAVVKDDLTSLHNRRFINERFPTELAMAFLKNEPLSILFIGADHEKGLEDDQIICAADVIKQNTGDNGWWAARYDNCKFFVCLRNTDITAAQSFTKKIKDAITDCNITLDFDEYTVSNKEGDLSYDGMIHLAESKLQMQMPAAVQRNLARSIPQ